MLRFHAPRPSLAAAVTALICGLLLLGLQAGGAAGEAGGSTSAVAAAKKCKKIKNKKKRKKCFRRAKEQALRDSFAAELGGSRLISEQSMAAAPHLLHREQYDFCSNGTYSFNGLYLGRFVMPNYEYFTDTFAGTWSVTDAVPGEPFTGQVAITRSGFRSIYPDGSPGPTQAPSSSATLTVALSAATATISGGSGRADANGATIWRRTASGC